MQIDLLNISHKQSYFHIYNMHIKVDIGEERKEIFSIKIKKIKIFLFRVLIVSISLSESKTFRRVCAGTLEFRPIFIIPSSVH